jgi:hypothetical protein
LTVAAKSMGQRRRIRYSSSYRGFAGAQERGSSTLFIHLIIDTYAMPFDQEWS